MVCFHPEAPAISIPSDRDVTALDSFSDNGRIRDVFTGANTRMFEDYTIIGCKIFSDV